MSTKAQIFNNKWTCLMKKAAIEKVSIIDVLPAIKKVNLELATILENLNPDSSHTLYVVNLPYGTLSVKHGALQIPNANGDMVGLNHSSISNEYKNEIGYNLGSNPVSLLLENCFEIFLDVSGYNIPIPYGMLFKPGAIVGAWKVLNPIQTLSQQPAFLWNISAGVRSIFMLPKISDQAGYKKITRELKINLDTPKKLIDHWQVFKKITSHSHVKENWSTKIVYFGHKWFEHLNDKNWNDFYLYLYKKSWQSSEYCRNNHVLSSILSITQKFKNLKPNPYVADTVKHLLATSLGASVGFAPAVDDTAAPIKTLQNIFINIYQLKEYAPIIMTPNYFSLTDTTSQPVYYSLQYPTIMDFSPRSKNFTNKIDDLAEIKHVLNKCLDVIKQDALNLSNTNFAKITDNVSFDIFHNHHISNNNDIKKTDKLFTEDKRFEKISLEYKNKKLPEDGQFLKGCIRVAIKK